MCQQNFPKHPNFSVIGQFPNFLIISLYQNKKSRWFFLWKNVIVIVVFSLKKYTDQKIIDFKIIENMTFFTFFDLLQHLMTSNEYES